MRKQRKIAASVVFLIMVAIALYALGAMSAFLRSEDDIYTAEGMVFTGELSDGRFRGIGKIVFENGDTYEGALSGGRFDGYGVFISAEGWRYEGYFSDGKPIGPGEYIFPE